MACTFLRKDASPTTPETVIGPVTVDRKRSFDSWYFDRPEVQAVLRAVDRFEQAKEQKAADEKRRQENKEKRQTPSLARSMSSQTTLLELFADAFKEVYGQDHQYVRTMSEDRPPLQDDEVIALARQAINSAREDTTRRTEADTDGVAKDLQQPGITIDLGHQNIRRLPEEVVDVIKDDIERLALSHNQLNTLPIKLTECLRLRYLNIRYNSLREFPQAVLQLSTLEILDVSKNKIREIPEEISNLTSLKVLAIQRNRIERLPLCLGDISSLHMLKLDGNPISFPPSDVCTIKGNTPSPSGDNERDAVITTQVKRYLRQIATRERLRVESEGDSSESTVETPRPMRVRAGGRFPVKPSISSMDAFAELKPASPGEPPPIPVRSHFRVQSQQNSTTRRPAITPLAIGNERNRSHSEGGGSANIRAKRMGIVTRKGTDLAPLNEARSSITSHTRGLSHSSVFSESSTTSQTNGTGNLSAPTSAVDQPRPKMPSARPLSDLLEHKPWSNDYDGIVKSCRLIAETAIDFLRPSEKLLRRISTQDQSALMTGLRRLKSSAYSLESVLDSYERLTEDQEDEADELFSGILVEADNCLTELSDFETLIHESEYDISKVVDDPGVRHAWRAHINIQYMGAVEARNACQILGVGFTEPSETKSVADKRQIRSSTTPTQTMPHPEQRMRITQGYENGAGPTNQFNLTPPMPATSRTNTLTSLTSATPRSGESFATLGSVSMSRSNTAQSGTDESDEERIFERIWQRLSTAVNLTLQALPPCHREFEQASISAKNDPGRGAAAFPKWLLAIERARIVQYTVNHLSAILSSIKLRDAEFRNSQTEFWEHCAAYAKAWSDLAMTVKEIGMLGQLPEEIKQLMKPIQKAVKEAIVAITGSPWSHLAVLESSAYVPQMLPMRPGNRPLGHGFGAPSTSSMSSSINGINGINGTIPVSSSYMHGHVPASSMGGYVTPVPATPLTAALGAAAQATVPSTPGHGPASAEQIPQPLTGRFAGNVFERADRLLQQTQRRV